MASETVHIPASGVTAELYRAAIGPRGQDYYLRHFMRFDANGKTSATWHWPAYWSTVNWLIYRRMWGWALAYVAALLGLALVIFGVGKLLFSYSDATALLLFLVLLTGAFVLPGLYANAWFYTYCNEKISAALRSTSEIKQACEALANQASTNKRWFGLASVNVAMMALLAGVVTFVMNPDQEGAHLARTRETPPQASGPLKMATQTVVAPASVVRPETQTSPMPPNAPAIPSPATSGEAAPQPTAPAKTEAVATKAVESPAAKVALSAEPVRPELPKPVQVAASTDKPTAAVPGQPAVVATPAVQVVAQAEPAPAVAVARPAPAVRVRYVWVVQIGAYAQEVNAQKTRARVEELGLETGAEPVTTASGQLIRVRVGPFTRRDEAEKAALRIKSLDLPALVLRQRP
jgi:cell division protein FtsN